MRLRRMLIRDETKYVEVHVDITGNTHHHNVLSKYQTEHQDSRVIVLQQSKEQT